MDWLSDIEDYQSTFEIPQKQDALYKIYFKKLGDVKQSYVCVRLRHFLFVYFFFYLYAFSQLWPQFKIEKPNKKNEKKALCFVFI